MPEPFRDLSFVVFLLRSNFVFTSADKALIVVSDTLENIAFSARCWLTAGEIAWVYSNSHKSTLYLDFSSDLAVKIELCLFGFFFSF